MSTKSAAAQVNPIVRKAADQVAGNRRASKLEDPPQRGCHDQLPLFDLPRKAKIGKGIRDDR
ncbi:hypothetical protein [Nocardia macrotermitis]|uniref:Uncharacterized protein n=1 Tax=Nocardia macrotermitis TaxID=2585198 RepID=A0A7K0D9L0_9NOCA|nr:hypothetical protein [Nocardia macrotermitis]MQY22455.1 hypothetical protein [Nocardia macrotermitis]